MNDRYDTIIIGGGHNGLTTAGFLAKAGKRVLLLERRPLLGGAASTEELFPGFRVNSGAAGAALLRPEVVEGLSLHRHGLEFIESPVQVFAPQPDGSSLTIWQDMARTQEEIARFSPEDAQRYPAFVAFVERMASVLEAMMTLTPPRLCNGFSLADLLPWARVALKARGLGRREMMDFLRLLPMSAREFLDEWFESQRLKGALGACSVHGLMLGPWASGTALMWLYQHSGKKGVGFVRGGVGSLSQALAAAVRAFGGEIRNQAEVRQILVEDGKVRGVALRSGEQFFAPVVASAAGVKHTLFELVGAPHFGVRFNRRVRNIRLRGVTAALHLGLRELPEFAVSPAGRERLSGSIVISPSLEYLERAYDAAKYGRISQNPYLRVTIPTLLDPSLAPQGQHVLSVVMQYAPFHLREGNWESAREALRERIIATLAQYAPDLRELILHQKLITPLDWERTYGLEEGNIHHGQMGLDQLMFMRPVGGWAQYRTPIEGLYLCGAGTHPGGGVSGAPGYNAAREILHAK